MKIRIQHRYHTGHMHVLLLFLYSFFLFGTAHSQDIHFSQFNDAPFNLNPGLTGMFDADIRITGNQRSQWRSVTIPYNTFALNADARGLIKKKSALCLGAGFSHDKAGDSRLRTTAIDLMAALPLNAVSESEHSFSAGVGLSMHFVGIDYSDLRYDNQWNGNFFDPNLDPNENYSRDARFYPDLSLGLVHTYRSMTGWSMNSGISAYNLISPQQSFFDITTVRLDPRINIHTSFQLPLTSEWTLEPTLLFASQGKYKELNIGSMINYTLVNERSIYRSIYGGLVFRARDAGYLVAGMKYDAWKVGLSYDINVSNLQPASNRRGGLEIAVVYLINLTNDELLLRKYCPDFF